MRMLYAKHESDRLGSDWTLIFRDLKTLRGVKKRLLQGYAHPGLWYIYRCAEQDWYKETGHVLVGVILKRA